MEKVLIFGHKNPDTDTITSSIVMANFENKLGGDAEACALGTPNKETQYVLNYLGIEPPELIEKVEEGQKVILVDHNEFEQSVDGLDEADILEIIDHHRLGGMQTMSPIFFRNQPLGCTATIIYQMYLENGVEIEPQIAGLLCSAIISDTLAYRSPTCTVVDKMAAEALAKIAGINVEQYAKEMFTAGSNLRNKTAEEIFYQDFKPFTIEGVDFAAGQITSMDQEELESIKDKIREYMEKSHQAHGATMIFFMLTNILEESTELLCCGAGAKELAAKAFAIKNPEEGLHLKGVVSRKKQLVPALALTLQQDKES